MLEAKGNRAPIKPQEADIALRVCFCDIYRCSSSQRLSRTTRVRAARYTMPFACARPMRHTSHTPSIGAGTTFLISVRSPFPHLTIPAALLIRYSPRRLSSVFPSTTPEPGDVEPASAFRRVPRLRAKVTLFVTASTHAGRRDELDLFVRQLFSLSRAVTSEPIVRDFFSVRSNGLDGSLPPSPTPSSASTSAFAESTKDGHGHGHGHGQNTAYASIRERSPSIEESFKSISARHIGSIRPSLAGKRSTPDLRRFLHATSSEDDAFSSPRPAPSPDTASVMNFRFPAHGQGRVSTAPAAGIASIRDCLASFELDSPTSPMRGGSDSASLSTQSTVRPAGAAGSRSRASSRIASPLSFNSAISELAVEDDYAAPLPIAAGKTRGDPGALKHFRSLQDMRSVPSSPIRPSTTDVRLPSNTNATQSQSSPVRPQPSPQQRPAAPLPSVLPVSAPVLRSRSDSKILSRSLAPVAEQEHRQHYAQPLRPSHMLKRASTAKSATSSNSSGRSRSGTLASKASIEDLARRAAAMMSMTPILPPSVSQSAVQAHGRGHRHTPSNSSIASTVSTRSSSSSSSSPMMYRSHSTPSSSATGLGLGFTSGSASSLESSSYSSSDSLASPIDSPDASFTFGPASSGPNTPEAGKAFDKWQHDALNGAFVYNNHLPPLPFFPTPGACDELLHLAQQQQQQQQKLEQPYQQQQHSHSTARRHGRHRASSLHTPVLETILASPILGGSPPTAGGASAEKTETAAIPSVTLKLMTSRGNYLMKVPKGASLLEVRERVSAKCKGAELSLQTGFSLALCTGAGGKDTSKSIDLDGTVKREMGAGSTEVELQDEEDWQLALSLATAKITLKVA